MNLLKNVFLIAIIVGVGLFGLNLWAAMMPQIWGRLPVHTPVSHAFQYCLAFSVAAGALSGLAIRKLLSTAWRASAVAAAMYVVALFLLAKWAVLKVESQSIGEGNQINTFIRLRYLEYRQFPTNDELFAEYPNLNRGLFKIHFDSEFKQWTLVKRSSYLWWWGVNYSTRDGWFYLID